MRVVVLGSGVVGVASAYYLARAGHEVTVIDREAGPALETSFANAGQISPGYAAPWAAPGVPLKAVLDKAGVKAGAVEVAFTGFDGPVIPETPDFAKSLKLDHARDGQVMLAWGMNGQDLPWLNGYPLRLVVPGFYGTYWVKHLESISVLDKPFDGFWMQKAYRIPDNDCACTEPGKAADKTVPINRFTVRSFLTNLTDGGQVKAGHTPLRGIAFDGGSGIKAVAVSTDDGKTWTEARLGQDLGPYAFRPWTLDVDLSPGSHAIRVRATANDGASQPMEPRWNPAGYLRNVVETTRVRAV